MSTILTCFARRNGIKKYVRAFTLSEISELLLSDAIISAEFNRDEVDKHTGNDVELEKSILTDWSICMVLAYWNGNMTHVKHVKDIKLTKENPLCVTEGGHRLRWLNKILKGETVIDGMTIGDIKTQFPHIYEEIMNYSVIVEIKTHNSGVVPLEYVKDEYVAVNTRGAPLNFGEIALASTDKHANELYEVFNKSFLHRMKKTNSKNRDGGRALIFRLIRSMSSGNFDHMRATDKTMPVVSYDMYNQLYSVISRIGYIEKQLLDSSTDKKLKTLLQKSIDDKFHGVLFYGMCKFGDSVLNIIEEFFSARGDIS